MGGYAGLLWTWPACERLPTLATRQASAHGRITDAPLHPSCRWPDCPVTLRLARAQSRMEERGRGTTRADNARIVQSLHEPERGGHPPAQTQNRKRARPEARMPDWKRARTGSEQEHSNLLTCLLSCLLTRQASARGRITVAPRHPSCRWPDRPLNNRPQSQHVAAHGQDGQNARPECNDFCAR